MLNAEAMENKKLTLDKSILTRLQDDQLAATVGGGERPCSGTLSTIVIVPEDEMGFSGEPIGDSCCRKSC